MDGSAAIERNRVALLRIVASLVAMAGGYRQPAVANRQSENANDATPSTPTAAACPLPTAAILPRHLWRAILRLLRPAESAARRLIIAAARGLVVPPPPPRGTCPRACLRQDPGARSPSPASQGRILGSGRPRRVSSPVHGGGIADPSAVARRAEAEGDGGGGLAQPHRIALPLFDRLRRVGPRPLASRDLPRICVPGWTERLPVPVRLAPSPDDPINAARLALRLDALARALDDLPGQARRFARWQAASTRAAAGAQIKDHAAAAAQNMNPAGARPARFRRLSPLRGGPPPGGRLARYDPGHRRRRETREIDEILAHAHELATDALARPDTS